MSFFQKRNAHDNTGKLRELIAFVSTKCQTLEVFGSELAAPPAVVPLLGAIAHRISNASMSFPVCVFQELLTVLRRANPMRHGAFSFQNAFFYLQYPDEEVSREFASSFIYLSIATVPLFSDIR